MGSVLQWDRVVLSEMPVAKNHLAFIFKHLSPLLEG